jgi:hypothetical protein
MGEQETGGGSGKFDPTRHLRQLRGRGGSADYLDVKWRLVWLRSEHPDAQIATEHVTITSDMAIFKAQVGIPGGGSATGYGSETSKDFTDFIEKAETKALGRALIALGYGTPYAQEFGEDDVVESAPSVRAVPTPPEAPRPERPGAAPQAAVAPRPTVTPYSPRPEPIPADTRRAAPPRPLREAEEHAPEPLAAAPRREVPEPRREPTPPAPTPFDDEPVPVRPLPSRPAPMQATPRPAPRPAATIPAPAPNATPAPASSFTREPLEEEDEVIDLANYGWTEFWSWARARGFNDRKSLDAVVGRATNGMTPLEIRKQIQAKQ